LGETLGDLGETLGDLGEALGDLGEALGDFGETLGDLGEALGDLGEALDNDIEDFFLDEDELGNLTVVAIDEDADDDLGNGTVVDGTIGDVDTDEGDELEDAELDELLEEDDDLRELLFLLDLDETYP
jgi:hypothetical protein